MVRVITQVIAFSVGVFVVPGLTSDLSDKRLSVVGVVRLCGTLLITQMRQCRRILLEIYRPRH